MTEWYAHALCAQIGPDFFFPEPGETARDAMRICAKCPVRVECLTEAIKVADNDGIRAGFDMHHIYMTARNVRGRVAPRKVAEEMIRRASEAADRPSFLSR